MQTDKKTTEMHALFRQVAAFCGLRLSYYLTEAIVAILFFMLVLTENRTVSPLYIVLSALVMPSIIKAMLFPEEQKKQKKKKESSSPLPLFCKKYRYDATMHTSFRIAYLILFIMLLAWRVSYLNSQKPDWIILLPIWTGGISLILRLGISMGYQIYFRHFPMKAMR